MELLIGNADDINQCTISDVAGITYNELDTAMADWTVLSRPATLIQKSKARRLLKACKLSTWVEWTVAEKEEYEEGEDKQFIFI